MVVKGQDARVSLSTCGSLRSSLHHQPRDWTHFVSLGFKYLCPSSHPSWLAFNLVLTITNETPVLTRANEFNEYFLFNIPYDPDGLRSLCSHVKFHGPLYSPPKNIFNSFSFSLSCWYSPGHSLFSLFTTAYVTVCGWKNQPTLLS